MKEKVIVRISKADKAFVFLARGSWKYKADLFFKGSSASHLNPELILFGRKSPLPALLRTQHLALISLRNGLRTFANLACS